jgi:cell division protein ZapA
MDDKLSIKVNLVDRYYPLKIDRRDEEKIRKAAKLINEKVVQYKQRYNDNDKDTQDFLAMAALQFVIKNLELEDVSTEQVSNSKLSELNSDLEQFLKEERVL